MQHDAHLQNQIQQHNVQIKKIYARHNQQLQHNSQLANHQLNSSQNRIAFLKRVIDGIIPRSVCILCKGICGMKCTIHFPCGCAFCDTDDCKKIDAFQNHRCMGCGKTVEEVYHTTEQV